MTRSLSSTPASLDSLGPWLKGAGPNTIIDYAIIYELILPCKAGQSQMSSISKVWIVLAGNHAQTRLPAWIFVSV